MMAEQPFQGYVQVLRSNINNHLTTDQLTFDPKQKDYRLVNCKSGNTYIQYTDEDMYADTEDGTHQIPPEEEPVSSVLVLNVCGPVTRSGDLCSYGSVDHRDLLLEAADDEQCAGVVFVIDTPGGSAFSMHDYRQGLDALKEAGKRSISFIDGICCSAGVALACQTDYITVMNPNDEIGCVGAMMAGALPVDGSVTDGYRFVYVTASQTPDKNLEYRLASEGDYSEIQSLVDDCAHDFLSLIEEMRPQILPDQRTGKVYKAKDVMGTLVDGVACFDDCVQYVLTGNLEMQVPATNTATAQSEDTNTTQQNMNYQNIMATLGVSELAVEENGIFLNAELVDQLDQALAPSEQTVQEEVDTQQEETPAEEPQEQPANEEAHEEAPAAVEAPVEEPETTPAEETPAEETAESETIAEETPAEEAPVAEEQEEVTPSAEQNFAEQLAAMQLQHEQEMQALRNQIDSLRRENASLESSTIPAPTPKNPGATKASIVSTPAKNSKRFSEMTMAEKKKHWESLGK